MNDTLKVAGRVGAELGAAKAENERLRGLLERIRTTCCQVRDAQDLDTAPGLSAAESLHEQIEKLDAALSQQAEPVRCPGTEDTASMDSDSAQEQYTAVDMATAAAQGVRDGQAALVEAAQGALSEIQATLEDAYLNAYQECCGQAYLECCGSPLQAWSEADQKIMDRFALHEKALRHALAAPIAHTAPQGKFRMGDLVKKSTGSEWVGRVVGWYSTEQTKEGYAVESSAHRNSVQIYPATALEAVE